MIKNVTYDFIKDKEEELVRVGIKEVLEMKNKTNGKSYNSVKALIIDEEKKQKLLNERFIRIGLSKIYLEDFVKPPTQCRKFKAFGHIEKTCKLNQKCGKCSGTHSEEECKESKENYKCANCDRNHSSFYRGCHCFREARNMLLLKKDKQPAASKNNINGVSPSPKTTNERSYSSIVSTNNNNDELLKRFETLLTSNKDLIIKQTTDVIKQESIAIQNRIESIMKLNNSNLCYFVMNTIKTLVPSVKFSVSKMKVIQEAFSNYQLGEIKLENLKNHFCADDNYLVNKSLNKNDESGENEFCPRNKYQE
jgi:hypothetical protein